MIRHSILFLFFIFFISPFNAGAFDAPDTPVCRETFHIEPTWLKDPVSCLTNCNTYPHGQNQPAMKVAFCPWHTMCKDFCKGCDENFLQYDEWLSPNVYCFESCLDTHLTFSKSPACEWPMACTKYCVGQQLATPTPFDPCGLLNYLKRKETVEKSVARFYNEAYQKQLSLAEGQQYVVAQLKKRRAEILGSSHTRDATAGSSGARKEVEWAGGADPLAGIIIYYRTQEPLDLLDVTRAHESLHAQQFQAMRRAYGIRKTSKINIPTISISKMVFAYQLIFNLTNFYTAEVEAHAQDMRLIREKIFNLSKECK